MTKGLCNELIKAKDEVKRLRKALKNSALHALYQGHRADDAEVELSEQNEILERLRAERDMLREALQSLLDAESAPTFDIVAEDDYGHPLNAIGVARMRARKILKGGE